MKERQEKKKPSITTVRHYAGCALTALINVSGQSPRNSGADEIKKQALAWGVLMAEAEEGLK